MTYLNDFRTQITNRDFPKFLQLWEEYCTSDHVDTEEFLELLRLIKTSDFAKQFGKIVETALPLWQLVKDKEESYQVLKLLIDLQTTNAPALADITVQALKERYAQQPQFNERLRLVGLRTREHFQGALSNYDLLSHLEKGNFVFHSGGWGTGEVTDISPVREQVSIEFENVSGKKHLTFDNAFKAIYPLPKTHFLARRFADADQLEKEAKEDPVKIIKMLLKDLGPKSASEIKDELCELVIPEADWTKWWQGVRARLKKDPLIEAPQTLKDEFKLRKTELTHSERFNQAIQGKTDTDEIILTAYNFVRDLPGLRQNADVKNSLRDKLLHELSSPQLKPEQELQICMLLEGQFGHKLDDRSSESLIKHIADPEAVVNAIDIVALKKRALVLIREHRKEWVELFLSMLRSVKQSNLREYLLKELSDSDNRAKLEVELRKLIRHPELAPDFHVWYFQQIVANNADKELPFASKEGQCEFFEAFLVLFSYLENKPEYRDLLKKMFNMISGKRYELVRTMMAGAKLEFIKEFLLLASKCQTIGDRDQKILQSLAEVAHPGLAKERPKHSLDPHTIWTTEDALLKTQEQVRHIGTVEIVENAREIEVARAHGDLRENSEFKFALEKRSRLQGQLKQLSDQLHHARVITKEDVLTDEVSVGTKVDVIDPRGKKTTYVILGPWDANVDNNILSFQSKLAQLMLGCKTGDTFQFRDEDFTIADIRSYFA